MAKKEWTPRPLEPGSELETRILHGLADQPKIQHEESMERWRLSERELSKLIFSARNRYMDQYLTVSKVQKVIIWSVFLIVMAVIEGSLAARTLRIRDNFTTLGIIFVLAALQGFAPVLRFRWRIRRLQRESELPAIIRQQVSELLDEAGSEMRTKVNAFQNLSHELITLFRKLGIDEAEIASCNSIKHRAEVKWSIMVAKKHAESMRTILQQLDEYLAKAS